MVDEKESASGTLTDTQAERLGATKVQVYRQYNFQNETWGYHVWWWSPVTGEKHYTTLVLTDEEISDSNLQGNDLEDWVAGKIKVLIEEVKQKEAKDMPKKYNVRVEYVPEASFDGIEWGWEAEIYQENVFETKVHKIDSKFGYASIQEARTNMEDVLVGFLPALSEDRVETFTREV